MIGTTNDPGAGSIMAKLADIAGDKQIDRRHAEQELRPDHD
jgi:hypothetical protein